MIVTLDPKLESKGPQATAADAQSVCERFTDREQRGRISVQSLFPVAHKLPGDNFHSGPMTYWGWCWDRHAVPVVDPDMVWQLVLGEVATIVRKDPEAHRHLFSTTQEKQTIIVDGSPYQPVFVNEIVDMLKVLVPTNTDVFLPNFTTSTPGSVLARNAMFCDVCSPFYDYCVKLCGFPAIDVRGTRDDWQRMGDNCTRLAAHFRAHVGYFAHLAFLFKDAAETTNGVHAEGFWGDFWGEKRCGSGSGKEVTGWVTSLFLDKPAVGKAHNYPTGVANVNFKCLDDGKDYRLCAGMMSSERKGNTLEPQWGHILYEKRPQEQFDSRTHPSPQVLMEMT